MSSRKCHCFDVGSIAHNGRVFAFVAHADTSILAGTLKGNDANTLLPAGAVYLVGCLFGTLKKFKIKALGGLVKPTNK